MIRIAANRTSRSFNQRLKRNQKEYADIINNPPALRDYVCFDGTPDPYPSMRSLPLIMIPPRSKLETMASFFIRDDKDPLWDAIWSDDLEKFWKWGDLVDNFYEFMHPMGWIYHRGLADDIIEGFLEDAVVQHDSEACSDCSGSFKCKEAQERAAWEQRAGEEMVEIYQSAETFGALYDMLKCVPNPGGEYERLFEPYVYQIDVTRELWEQGYWVAVVNMILPIVDGAVQNFELKQSQSSCGLASDSRKPETMVAYRSPVGHKYGLSYMLANSYRGKGSSKTRRAVPELLQEYELLGKATAAELERETKLSRNRMLHGVAGYYHDPIIAAKAWNLLFSVADWAASVIRADSLDAKSQHWPKPVTFVSLVANFKDYLIVEKPRRKFTPMELTPDSENFYDHPVAKRFMDFINVWEREHWGKVLSFTDSKFDFWGYERREVNIKEYFLNYPISDFKFTRINLPSYRVAKVKGTATIQGKKVPLNFTLEFSNREGNSHPSIPDNECEWYISTWDNPATSYLLAVGQCKPW